MSSPWLERGQAAQFTVQMTPAWTFSPSNLQIQASDTVTWVNMDDSDYHDSVSSQGIWDSGPVDYLGSYSLQFPVTGTFPYADSFYDQYGMMGTIVVKPATLIPPPLLTNALTLANGFQFSVTNLIVTRTNILQASTDLVNWTAIYTNVATRTGYTYLDTRPAVQRRFYRALVLPYTAVPQPLLTNALAVTNGFQFSVTNLIVSKTNILQASTNLVNWTAIYTNVATKTGYTYLDTRPAVQRRFYRALVLP
ncbi:MAG: hypothetical protein C5B50_16180 [Verrucomicrobia bacterium]|nr:MAG: hypothetical protein C5B50_16180 [Verrucomicrobiota bacterium]